MLDDIRVFVQVVAAGSFTEAANQLGISKSVVSKYVSRLESQLNVRLLNRSTRKLSLTEAGRLFYARCTDGLREIDEAVTEVGLHSEQPRGLLRLNTPMSFGITRIAPLLPGFMAQYPEIQVDMQMDDSKIDMIEPGFDVTIRASELQDSALVARRLMVCPQVIIAAPDYLARAGCPETLQDLAEHPVVSFSHHNPRHEWLLSDQQQQSHRVMVTEKLQMNSSLAIRQAVLGGVGIARVPLFVVDEDLEAGRLVQLLPEYHFPDVPLYAVFPQRRYQPAKVKVFIEFLVARFS